MRYTSLLFNFGGDFHMQKIYHILISMKTMILLTFIFAIASAVATFIENDYGTETAWAVVYGTRWFEIVMVLLAINLIGNIFRYNLFRKEKWPALLFHAGFLIILIGAAVSRYMGYEGTMHIREGMTQNQITSSESYIQIAAQKGTEKLYLEQKLLMSKITPNNFTLHGTLDGKPLTVTFKNYFPVAHKSIVEDPHGEAMINMVVAEEKKRPQSITLKAQDHFTAGSMDIALNGSKSDSKPEIQIYTREGKFYFKSSKSGNWTKMADQSSGKFEAGKEYPFVSGQLYDFGSVKLVPKELYPKATVKVVSGEESAGGRRMKTASKSALVVSINYNGETKEVPLMGFGRGTQGIPEKVNVGGAEFQLVWGSKTITLPFGIKLNDFQLERYPGSMSPSSYASEVTLIDKERNVEMPYRIFMNHVLDYRHYRFFQASYDQDEKGTVLSVNNDPGKVPTYIGYFMLALGLLLTLLNPKSRFRKLAKAVTRDVAIKLSFAIIAFGVLQTSPLMADSHKALEIAKSYSKAHADKFGDLLLQTTDGRITPIATFADDVMLKLHKSSSVEGLNSSQVLLGMITAPGAWQDIKLIKVKHDKIRKILGLKPKEKYASFNDFFDNTKKQSYKLGTYIEEANQKRPIKRNEFDRSVIKADEKLNIMYMIFTGDLMKIVPKVDDPNNTWYSVKTAISSFPQKDSEMIRLLFINYFTAIDDARKSGDWSKADKALEYIQTYQKRAGKAVIPPDSKLKAEKFFKKYSITNKLIPIYTLAGLLLLGLVFYKIVKPEAKVRTFAKTVTSIFYLAFALHTLVLAARWYIGGHAPWSNAYEAMLYVAWAMALSGVIFARFSIMVPALTAIIAGSTLAATFFNEMNPQITNLVPVLKSYWLNIHVSVITASYGFLALSAILGLFTLILFIMRGKNPHIDHSIVEATRINEMTAIIGLAMLTVGNFLGGVWANESWGRYWSWDPKETWAWISILVYTIVLHVRFIPEIKKHYTYHFAWLSTVAYASIIMTFLGVNYYLSGMHSYAAGDPVPVPKYLYVIIVAILAIIAAAYPKRNLTQNKDAAGI
jgi:cytochrome c-type biogenesis protein CcsB